MNKSLSFSVVGFLGLLSLRGWGVGGGIMTSLKIILRVIKHMVRNSMALA